MLAPLIIFLVLWAGWSVAWFVLHDMAGKEVDRWFAREASMGRMHDCPVRTIGGYPFRIDVSCTNASFRFTGPRGESLVSFAGITLTALVYNPRHLIADMIAPVSLTEGGVPRGTLNFKTGQASLRLTGEGLDFKHPQLERASLVFTHSGFGLTDTGPVEASSDLFELHVRPAGALGNGRQSFDLALLTQGWKLAAGRPDLGATISLAATINDWPVLPMAGSAPLRQWADAGGTAKITALRMERGTGLMTASGDVRLSPAGQWNAAYEAIIADGQVLFSSLGIPGLPDIGPALIALPFMSRPAPIENRQGSKVRLDVVNGLITLGRFQLVQLPPAF